MSYVVRLEGLLPGSRDDSVPWTLADIYESATATGVFALIDSQAITPVDANPAAPAIRNFTTSLAQFSRGFYKVVFKDAFGGTQETDVIGLHSSLISLDDYKLLTGVDPTNTRDDAQVTALLDAASQAITTYTGRDFEIAAGSTVARQYLYDGSGFLDIDDCTDITNVELVVPGGSNYTLTANEYTAMPSGGPVLYYLILHGGIPAYGISPEMGFTWNLDTYGYSQPKAPTVAVTAAWGWATIPPDVKLAAALTIQGFIEAKGTAENLTAESIEAWSRSWGGKPGTPLALAIPNKARDLLANYQRIYA